MVDLKTKNNIFLIIAIIATIPALISKYFPAVDSPSHLEISNALYYLVTDPQDSFFSHYFKLNITPVNTNWFFYLFTTILINKLPIFVIEKIILCTYFIAFILVAKYLGNLSNNKINISGFFSIPLVYNFALHGGFYSFLFGLTASFFAIAYYLRHEDTLKSVKYLILFCLFNLIYLLHPFTFAMTLGILFTYSIGTGIIEFYINKDLRRYSLGQTRNLLAKKVGFILCGLPGIICLLLTFSNSSSTKPKRETFIELIRILSGFHFLWSYDRLEIILGRILILSVFTIFIIYLWKKIKRAQIEKKDGLILALLFCIILYFLSPESLAGGGSINIRISAYIYFLTIVWLGYQNYQKTPANIIKYFCICVFSLFLIFNSVKSIQIGDLIQEYMSVSPYVREKSTLVSFSFVERGLNIKDRFITNHQEIGQIAGYIAASRNGINLNNYQSTRDNFPIKFRSEIYPRTWLISKPPQIADYNLKTQGSIDYVLIWGSSNINNNNYLKQIMAQLNDNYHLVHTSIKRGLAKLYEIDR